MKEENQQNNENEEINKINIKERESIEIELIYINFEEGRLKMFDEEFLRRVQKEKVNEKDLFYTIEKEKDSLSSEKPLEAAYIREKDTIEYWREEDKVKIILNDDGKKNKNDGYQTLKIILKIYITEKNEKIFRNLSYMFYGCKALYSVKGLSKLNSFKINNMSSMFYGCYHLEKVEDIEKLDVSNVTNMCCLFYECKSLQTLDLSKWVVSKVQYMNYLFCQCICLEFIIGINKWDIAQVINADNMFNGCGKLKNLNEIKKMDFSKVIYKTDIFDYINENSKS